MIDQLCQAYHWPFDQAMKMTMPQIVMLNHASWVNGKKIDTQSSESKQDSDTFRGKKIENLNSDELLPYYADFLG